MLLVRPINDTITLGLLDLAAFAKQKEINVKREIERAGTSFLLASLLPSKSYQLRYTAFNKPYLEGRSEHISISHSHDKLAIIVNSRENTGIDIELIRDKVINIQDKFLHPEELKFAGGQPEKLITLWAAKEAMYKVHGEKELEFAKHLRVPDFDNNTFVGSIEHSHLRRRFLLQAETVDNYKMVYVLHEL